MPAHRAHRCWIVAYVASWVLAAGGVCAVLAAVVATNFRGRLIDDGAALLGLAIGGLLGCLAARSTLRHRGVHRGLVVVGALAAVTGIAGAVSMFAAAATPHGEGPYAGLGDVVGAVASAAVAAIGLACLAAGTAGRLAARTGPEPG